MGLVQFHDAQALFVDRDPGAVGGRHFCQPLDDAVFGREPGVAGAETRLVKEWFLEAACIL